MMSAVMGEDVQVGLARLADTANREHQLAVAAGEAALANGTSMIEHAIAAGTALLAAREAYVGSDWQGWVTAHFQPSYSTAQSYMRVAGSAEQIRAERITSLRVALDHLKGQTVVPMGRRPTLGPDVTVKARELVEGGVSANEAAERLGVSPSTVRRLTDAEYAERIKAKARRQKQTPRSLYRELRAKDLASDLAEAAALTERALAALERASAAQPPGELKGEIRAAVGRLRKAHDAIGKLG